MPSQFDIRNITCFGKIPHTTFIDAMNAVESAERRYGERFRYYPCYNCGEYHIGRVKEKVG